jgi:hypothetical protein
VTTDRSWAATVDAFDDEMHRQVLAFGPVVLGPGREPFPEEQYMDALIAYGHLAESGGDTA